MESRLNQARNRIKIDSGHDKLGTLQRYLEVSPCQKKQAYRLLVVLVKGDGLESIMKCTGNKGRL